MIANIYPDSEWEHARLGCFTSSEIHNLLSQPKSKEKKENDDLSKSAKDYIYSKAAELLTGTVREFSSSATDWGNDQEPYAIEFLKKDFPNIEYFGNENRKFFKLTKYSGGSPDAIYGNIVFEIKCPENPANHIENMLIENSTDLKNVHKDYWCQLQMNIACVAEVRGINISDIMGLFISFCPLMMEDSYKLRYIRVMPDMEFQEYLKKVINNAENKLIELLKSI